MPASCEDTQCLSCLLKLGMDYADDLVQGSLSELEGADFLADGVLPKFDDYELIKEIDRGGMGVVYRAKQVSLNRTVAIKTVLAGQLATKSSLQRFQIEAIAAGRLDHPGIVPIYEVGEAEGQHFFSMKLIEGSNLAAKIDEYSLLSSENTTESRTKQTAIAKLVAKVAEAVAYAHQHGVLHRDIKPNNILVDREGQPHLTDFGLAKLTCHESNGLTLTSTIVGSPSYIAPEQAVSNPEDVTIAADVYGLGAVLYELLTGRPPFIGNTVLETVRQVTDDDPVAPRKIVSHVHPDLETIALKCLEKQPTRRYATATDVALELRRFAEGKPILARPVGPLQELWRWANRNRRVSLLAGFLLLALLLGTVGVAWQSRVAARANERLTETVSAMTWTRISELVRRGQVRLALMHLARVMRQDPTNWQTAMYAMSILDETRWHIPVGPQIKHPNDAFITVAKLDPTGRFLATGAADKTIRFWSVDNSTEMGDHLTLAHPVRSLEFDPTGKHMAIVSDEARSLQLFDVESRKAIRSLQFDDRIIEFEFAARNGELLLAEGTQLHLLDSDLETLSEAHDYGQKIVSLTCSDDAGRAVLRLANRQAIVVDTASGDVLLRIAEFPVLDATISPDGRLVAASEADFGTVCVWDIESGERRCTLETEEGDVQHLMFAADGSRLFASSVFQEWAMVFDTSTGLQCGSRMIHGEAVTEIVDYGRNQQLMMASRRDGAYFWDAASGAPSSKPIVIPSRFISAGIAESGVTVWTGSASGLSSRAITSIQLWRLHEPDNPPYLSTNADPYLVSAAAISPDGEWVVSGTVQRDPKSRRLIDFMDFVEVSTGKLARELLPLDSPPYGAAFTPDGSKLVITSVQGKLYKLSVPDFQLRVGPIDAGDPIQPSRMCPTGRRFATGSSNGWVTVWDVDSMTPLWKRRHSESRLNDLQFSESGKWLGSCANDNTAKIWDAATGEIEADLVGHQGIVYHIDLDETKQIAATGSEDRSVMLWDLTTGKMFARLDHVTDVGYMDIHPTKSLIVTADPFGRCVIWDTRTGALTGRPMVHDHAVQTVLFSKDGKRILAADQRGFRLWDTETQQPLTVLHLHPTQASLGVDSDGSRPQFLDNGDKVFCGPVSYGSKIWHLPSPRGDVPGWFPKFLESIVMKRLGPDSDIPIPVETGLHELKTQLSGYEESDYLRWCHRWLHKLDDEPRNGSSIGPGVNSRFVNEPTQ